jgi:hypothetical protein
MSSLPTTLTPILPQLVEIESPKYQLPVAQVVPRSIGEVLYPDITIEETHSDQLTITDHPVQGASGGNISISDHAFKMPSEVTITYGWSPSGPGNKGLATNYLNELYQKILDLQNSLNLLTIYTGRRVYKNMLIQGISVTTDMYTNNALVVRMTCREVLLAELKKVTVSMDPSGLAFPDKNLGVTENGNQSPQPTSSFNFKDPVVRKSLFGSY